MFDINTLTLGEVAKVEEISGQAITSVGDAKTPKARLMCGLAFVIQRRSLPGYTLKLAEALTLAEAQEIIGWNDDDDDESVDVSAELAALEADDPKE